MTDFQIITDSGCLGDMSFYNDNGIDIIPFQAIIDSKYYNLDDKFPLSNTNIEKIISLMLIIIFTLLLYFYIIRKDFSS